MLLVIIHVYISSNGSRSLPTQCKACFFYKLVVKYFIQEKSGNVKMQYTEFPKALLVILLILGILHTQDMRVDMLQDKFVELKC